MSKNATTCVRMCTHIRAFRCRDLCMSRDGVGFVGGWGMRGLVVPLLIWNFEPRECVII